MAFKLVIIPTIIPKVVISFIIKSLGIDAGNFSPKLKQGAVYISNSKTHILHLGDTPKTCIRILRVPFGWGFLFLLIFFIFHINDAFIVPCVISVQYHQLGVLLAPMPKATSHGHRYLKGLFS